MIIEENILVSNKTQAEKKLYASNAIFRVDVNPFLYPAGRLPADLFRYP